MCKFTLSTQFLSDLDSEVDFSWYDEVADALSRGFPLACLDMVSELTEMDSKEERKAA